MNLATFFAELKRRNVYKVAIAYGVVAWLVMQKNIVVHTVGETRHEHGEGFHGGLQRAGGR